MRTLTATELETIRAKLIEISDEPLAELDFSADDLDLDLAATGPTEGTTPGPTTAPAPTRPSKRAVKVSIRIPARTLGAFKSQAALKGTGYQTLIVQTLRAAAAGWEHL